MAYIVCTTRKGEAYQGRSRMLRMCKAWSDALIQDYHVGFHIYMQDIGDHRNSSLDRTAVSKARSLHVLHFQLPLQCCCEVLHEAVCSHLCLLADTGHRAEIGNHSIYAAYYCICGGPGCCVSRSWFEKRHRTYIALFHKMIFAKARQKKQFRVHFSFTFFNRNFHSIN